MKSQKLGYLLKFRNVKIKPFGPSVQERLKYRVHGTLFRFFTSRFQFFSLKKTISSIKIDGYGSTGVKPEQLELLKPKTRKRENGKLKKLKNCKTENMKNCKSEKLQNRELAKAENGGHDSIQMFGPKNSFFFGSETINARRQLCNGVLVQRKRTAVVLRRLFASPLPFISSSACKVSGVD